MWEGEPDVLIKNPSAILTPVQNTMASIPCPGIGKAKIREERRCLYTFVYVMVGKNSRRSLEFLFSYLFFISFGSVFFSHFHRLPPRLSVIIRSDYFLCVLYLWLVLEYTNKLPIF
jgi:hypothetical protein